MMLCMGYRSFKDFAISLFGLMYKEVLIILTIMVTTIYLGVDRMWHIAGLLYRPEVMMVMVLGALSLDWMSGVYRAIQNKNFQTDKAKRIIPTAIANILLLISLYQAECYMVSELSSSAQGVFHTFRIALNNYMFFVPILSAAVNASEAGILNSSFVRILAKYVDTHKNN